MKKRTYPELADRAWLVARYVGDGLSMESIASLLGCSRITVLGALRRHNIPSRGAGSRGGLTHGHATRAKVSPTYSTWRNMVARCTNPRFDAYRFYGARGIAVCDRWRTFENFLADMGEKPEGLTLERIDVNGNYEPANCRWATWAEQHANTRRRREGAVQ